MLLITKTDPELNKRKETSQRYERQGRVITDHCVILSSCCLGKVKIDQCDVLRLLNEVLYAEKMVPILFCSLDERIE